MRFSKIHIRELGGSPAAVNRSTGELHLAPSFFALPETQQRFVLWHEWGHYTLDTKSELHADKYAFAQYAHEGLPLSEAVYALFDVLDMSNAAHAHRANCVLEQANAFDSYFNPTRTKLKTKENRMDAIKQAFQQKEAEMDAHLQAGHIDAATEAAHQLCDMMPPDDQAAYWVILQNKFQDFLIQLSYSGVDLEGFDDEENEFDGNEICAGGDCDDFDGDEEFYAGFYAGAEYAGSDLSYLKTPEQEARAAERAAARAAKIKAKEDANTRKNTRTDAAAAVKIGRGSLLENKGKANLELAQQGISTVGQGIAGLGDIAKTVGGMFGKKNDAAGAPVEPGTEQKLAVTDLPPATPTGMPAWAWILIAVALLAAIGGTVWYIKSKKA